MSSFRLGPRHRFPSSATLLTIGAFVVLLLWLVCGIVGFIATP